MIEVEGNKELEHSIYEKVKQLANEKGITINIKITIPFTVVALVVAVWAWVHK